VGHYVRQRGDKAVEVVGAAAGKMTVKNHSISKDGYNGRGESLDKAVQGVLLQSRGTCRNIHWTAKRLFC
jgi:hypothetical protein